MSFWVLPPEINSSRLYAGPGSAPMMSAAAAWDTLSTALYSGAAEATAAITSLDWTGPSATAMRLAWLRQQTWLHHTAAHAERTACHARAASGAYEVARASAAHPALVATNRTQTAALIATNLLGQNSATIAALEAQYAAMWAQDITAMSTYLQHTQGILGGLGAFDPLPSLSGMVPALITYLLGGDTVPQLFWNAATGLLSTDPFQATLGLLALMVSLNAVAATAGAAAPPPPPTPSGLTEPLPRGVVIRAERGTAQRHGSLSLPRPPWAGGQGRPGASRPRPLTALPETPHEVLAAIPFPTPTRAGAKGAEHAENRGPSTIRFVPRPPSGG